MICQSIKRLVSARGFKITKPCDWVTAFGRCEKFKEIEPNRLLGSTHICWHLSLLQRPGYVISHSQVAGGHSLPGDRGDGLKSVLKEVFFVPRTSDYRAATIIWRMGHDCLHHFSNGTKSEVWLGWFISFCFFHPSMHPLDAFRCVS